MNNSFHCYSEDHIIYPKNLNIQAYDTDNVIIL